MKRNAPSTVLCLALLTTTPLTANSAVTDKYKTSLSNGCELTYEFSANLIAQLDLIDSDKEAVAGVIYHNYTASHDMAAEFAKFPSGRGYGVDLPAHTVRTTNDLFVLGNMLDANLKFKVQSARIFCGVSARYELERQAQVDRSVHQLKIERAISFVHDADETVQRRGLAALIDDASKAELQALPEDQRMKVIELAYRESMNSLAGLDERGLPRSGEFDFGAISLLRRLDDPRAVDLYLTTLEKGHASLQISTLKNLSYMLPRPTQALDRIATMVEQDRIAWQARDQAIKTLIRIGRMDSRPIFERFARGKDESLARESMEILDQMNAQAVVSKPVEPTPAPRTKDDDDVVVLPQPKI